jgi:membrane complex biogenesis BtpA family protein
MPGGRLATLFPERKPVIAMAHVPPLPGTPLYDAAAGVRGLVSAVERDLEHLLVDGIDAVMFCNEGDRPYQLHVGPEVVAAMAHVVGRLAPTDRPFGVDILWDAQAAVGLGIGTGAAFVREVVTGVYESDMGPWAPDPAPLLRSRRACGADAMAILMNITPEFASRLGQRSAAAVARSVVVSSLPDAILVSGPMAGAEPDVAAVAEIKEAVGDDVWVLVNTGAKSTNIAEFLRYADGCIVGSDLKEGGGTWNPVDPSRVRRFLDAAAASR